MQASLTVTFFHKDYRQYFIQIDINSDYTEAYISRSVILKDNPGDHNRQDSHESATYTWSAEAIAEYYRASPTLFPPTVNGILSLLDSVGPEWAGVFQNLI